jgi:plastocyanin
LEVRVRRFLFSMSFAMAVIVGACSSPPAAPPVAPASTVPASEAGLTSVIGKAPRGAFVLLEPSTPRDLPVPATPVVMDQLGKQFIPGTIVVRAGQPVEFRNSEDIPHNVYVKRSPTGREVLNISTDPTERYAHTFDEPGQYEVSCDLHSGMFASILVVTTPYTAVADERGAFVILNVPPGAYKLTASLGGKEIARTLDIAGPHVDVGNAGL